MTDVLENFVFDSSLCHLTDSEWSAE